MFSNGPYIRLSDSDLLFSTTNLTTWHALFQILQIPTIYPLNLQWIIIDAKVFDISKFKALHPGGLSVLLDPEIGIYSLPPIHSSSIQTYLIKVAKMQQKFSLAFTDMKFWRSHNISDCKSVSLTERNHWFMAVLLGNLVKFHTLNQLGYHLAITALTIQR